MTSAAAEPVKGDFDLLMTFSDAVTTGTTETEGDAGGVFVPGDDIHVAHGSLYAAGKLSAAQWRITIRPDLGYRGTLRVTVPEGVMALAEDIHSRNAKAEFEILVDTVFDDPALASLSLSDPNGSGVSLEPAFRSGHTEYEATFGRGLTVRVHAAVRDPGATFVIRPRFDQSDQSAGHDVLLTPGRATEISVIVTATLDAAGGTRAVPIAVAMAVAGSTATAGGDFREVADFTLTIPAHQRSGAGTFSLNAIDDGAFEDDETIIVSGASSGLALTGATLALTEDDVPWVTMQSAAAAVDEGGSVTFTLTREGPLTPLPPSSAPPLLGGGQPNTPIRTRSALEAGQLSSLGAAPKPNRPKTYRKRNHDDEIST